MKVTINDKTFELKSSFRAMMIYENITNKTFAPASISELIIFFYSTILASAKDIELQYDDFMDWIDENPDMLNEFSEWIVNTSKQNSKIKKK